jgi:hypothetical protein
MAMVHAAIYDAVNAIDRRHAVYAVDISAPPGRRWTQRPRPPPVGLWCASFRYSRP